MIRGIQFGAFFAIVASGVFFEVRDGFFSGLFRPITVALLDTGIDTRIPAIALRLSPVAPRNYFDNNTDVTDLDGHGTKVALAVLSECARSDCRILPLKMTRNGAGVTPKDTAAAIRYAVEAGARVVNISYGMSQGSPELEAALGEARAHGTVVVAAAGTALLNPFRAEPLAGVYPQSYPDTLVVGAAHALGEPDIAMNFGPELDVVAIGQADDAFGSSLAAASLSGLLATVLRHFPKLGPEHLRAGVRLLATPPKAFYAESGPISAASFKFGFGGLDLERLRQGRRFLGDLAPASRLFWNAQGEFSVDLSSEYNIVGTQAAWNCGDQALTEGLYGIETQVFKKGRAQVYLRPGSDKSPASDAARVTLLQKCRLKILLNHHDDRHGDFNETLVISIGKN